VYPEIEGRAPQEMTTLVGRTETGMILGTLGYLSPEQAAGKRVDFRSDQFALGALLYELATGERPFERPTTPESLTAVIREEPEPLRTKNASVPAQLGWIVERCLAKDPNDRYASTRDLARDLADLRDHLSEILRSAPEASPTGRETRPRHLRVAWIFAALFGAGLIASLIALARAASDSAVTYRPLTFRRGIVNGARFSPDGQTVYYSAAYGAEPSRIFATRLEGTESTPIDLPPAMLLSVSPAGELAILLTTQRNQANSLGTLARVPAVGGTPRKVLENVIGAEWAPDGERLAVVRDDYALELPIGKRIPPDVFWPRFSPRGDRIAFVSGSSVRVVGLEGRTLVDHEIPFAFGLAWRPDGREVWFTGDESGGGDRALYALAMDGERRRLAAAPGALTLQDVSPDGQHALVTTGAGWWSTLASRAGQPGESILELSGRSFSHGLSRDGRWVLAYEFREHGRGSYLLATDGSQRIRIGDDVALALSPDAAWALCRKAGDRTALILVPTGPGLQREIATGPAPDLRPVHARWSLDGRRLFVAFSSLDSGDGIHRIFLLEAGDRWRAVTPEIVGSPSFGPSPDGTWLAARDATGTLTLFPVDGGAPRRIEGEVRTPVQWSSAGDALYLQRKEFPAFSIFRFELASGKTEAWKEIGPLDLTGASALGDLFLTSDGNHYAYDLSRSSNELYLVEGLE
ncbi:MAG TPA: protein kinase, partial [Thermoanaerobaculia bacterium]|nr:protein kinase [Thermoanaerobaculia bacterium]